MSNELKAFCTSRKCAQIRYENLSNYAVKDVKKTQIECLDCGSVLLWKKENSRAKVKDIVHPRNRPKKVDGDL